MRGNAVIVAVLLLAGCATSTAPPSSSKVAHWEERDISELVAAIGPYDTTSVKGDWRSYDWFRFGSCHLTARTTLEGKIREVEAQGVGTGCDVYLQKLGAS
ncbi:MAG TPA: hypothetical protein VMN79_04745 [Casimicrobiaceae bacterium]|nr:hypothetical protein [Casimicrobiaceae bacterium]